MLYTNKAIRRIVSRPLVPKSYECPQGASLNQVLVALGRLYTKLLVKENDVGK